MEIKRYKSESDNKIDQLARTLKEQYPDMVFGEGSTFLLSLLLEQVKIVGERDAALTAVREEVERLEKSLKAIIECKIFEWRFDHCGAMNATQLSERDLFIRLWKNARAALGGINNEDSH
jgi:hypothetical protein